MSSIDKLKRLTGENKKQMVTTGRQRPEIADLRCQIEAIIKRGRANAKAAVMRKESAGRNNLHEFVPGAEMENKHGRFFLVSDIVQGHHRHGYRNIREAFNFDLTAAAMLANNPHISEYSAADALFLDTETTGLAGGTGTMAFLIGLGWFEAGRFQVRQLLARDFSEEKAALCHLATVADGKKFLVTFNGKAFDINLLATRFIMNRLECGLHQLPHLDLLHPSRRILGHRLTNSRLATLEAEILGFQREGDIPGWEIPQRYFDWLKRRDGRLLAAVFEHNRLDVISMAALTAHLTEILDGYEMNGQADDGDYLAAARLMLTRHDQHGAVRILERFGEGAGMNISVLSKKDISLLYKRCGRRQEAANLWEEILATQPANYFALTELAKWLEHRVGDFFQAKELIEKGLRYGNSFSAEEKQSLLHRLERLQGKMEKRQ